MQLETKRLLLRDYEDGDFALANAWESDPEVVRYMTPDVRTIAQSKEHVERVRRWAAEKPRRIYELAIVTFDDAQVIGKVGLRCDEEAPGCAEAWFALRRDMQGHGYAYEATHALMDFAFKELKLHRIYGYADPRNAPSWKLLEKLGMRREGHLVKNVFLKGEWCDSLVYAVLGEEWRPGAS